jgi:Geranylgeranyl pyrophosphate synthase
MCHELFAPLNENTWNTAVAIELFHNFTLMHDDIMDHAPLRRGQQTVHEKYGVASAILAGDVMNIFSYVHLNKIESTYIHAVLDIFNQTAIEICEGQQLDMDFEKSTQVTICEYIEMITLKTSVLLGASMKLGGILGGASSGCCDLLYSFGKMLGIAFQLKDDYLDTFGDPAITGKQIGGDIKANKKTYLYIKALEMADEDEKNFLNELFQRSDNEKVEDMIGFLKQKKIDQLLENEVAAYSALSYELLEKIPVMQKNKLHLYELVDVLLNRKK